MTFFLLWWPTYPAWKENSRMLQLSHESHHITSSFLAQLMSHTITRVTNTMMNGWKCCQCMRSHIKPSITEGVVHWIREYPFSRMKPNPFLSLQCQNKSEQ